MRLLHLPGRRLAVCAAALPIVTGCYSARPIRDLNGVPQGERVVVTLTSGGTDALTQMVGPQVRQLEGELVGAATDSLELRLLRTVREDNRTEPWQRQRVRVARTQVAAVEERRLDRTRSWLMAGAVVAGVVLLGLIVNAAGGESGEAPPLPPAGGN
jgi:hypothetical protein